MMGKRAYYYCRLVVLLAVAGTAMLTPSAHSSEMTLTIYLSPSGDDAADGLEPQLDMQVGKGPVRTIERAQALIRLARAADRAGTGTYSVVFRGGRYELARPLTFHPEDSGEPGRPVTYRSYPGELAHISGGRQVSGWLRKDGGIWSARYHDSLSPDGCPSQLFIGGERRSRPRLPIAATFRIGRVAGSSTDGMQPNDRFYALPGDLPDRVDIGNDTEIVVFDAWTASRMRLNSWNSTSGLLKLSGKFAGHGKHQDMTSGLPYYIENVKVNAPNEGSWQCDSAAGEIRYHPYREEAFPQADVVASRIGTLVTLQGRDAEPVHDIHFENLYFEHSAWHLPPDGWAAMQAEVGLPAAIEIDNARRISLVDFALVHTGADGIGIRKRSSDIFVAGGELRDIGGSGIAIGSSQRGPRPGTDWADGNTSAARTHDILIRDNLLASLGRIHWAAVGVWIGQADHVTVERNEIRDLYYTGISSGWTWNYGPTLSRDNRIVGNLIRDYGQGALSDLGGIYTLGAQPGSLVAENVIINGVARVYGGHGLYADAASGGIEFRDNLVSSVSHAAIHVHYGTNLLFEGNVLLNYHEAGIRCTRPSQGVPVTFRFNMLESGVAPPVFGVCGDSSYVFENDLVRDPGDRLRLMAKAASGTTVDFRAFEDTDHHSVNRPPGGALEFPPAGTASLLLDDALERAGRVSPLRWTAGMLDPRAVLP